MNNTCKSCLCLLALVALAGCPCCEEDDTNYSSADIERIYNTPEEAALIEIAENICPLREDVLAVAAPDDRAVFEAEAGDGCLWWYDYEEAGEYSWKVPYAITTDVVDYFAARITEFQDAGSSAPTASLTYTGTIQFGNSFTVGEKQYENVYLVEMNLSYAQTMRMLGKHRSVLISAEGEVLAIFGDGVDPVFTPEIAA